ncbi:MAG: CDP-diacylglycerol--serine O-phosphatidyltransferase [Gammaproteobacteria bacterium]
MKPKSASEEERRQRPRGGIFDKRKPRHAVYLLPNAFTTAALFAGFFAILQAIGGDWQQAAVAVVAASLLDACDGRIARWTGTQSSFGAEYDSLSDVISFGVAPALIAYQWSLAGLGKLGLGAAFCYCAATALRLARFNINSGDDRRFFIGIPSPAAAVLMVAYIATMDAWGFAGDSPFVAGITAIFYTIAALTMVGGVRYYSFKDFNIRRRRVPFRYAAFFFVAAAGLYALADTLMELLLVLLSAYLLSGYVYAAWKLCTRRREKDPPHGE